MNEKDKVRYYKNELEDDFASNKNIEKIRIDSNYKYIHNNIFWKIGAFIIYRIIILLPAYIYSKLKYKIQIVGREKIKEFRKTNKKGFFVYQNHTQEVLDTFFPTIIAFPKKAYIIANSDNVSIKGLRLANKMMGALPIPEDKVSSKNFLEAIQFYINKGKVISIYPEAHVWPYYTKIRNFKSVSFKYPVKYDIPMFVATTTYQKIKKEKVKIVVYIDGPFYSNKEIARKQSQEELRNKAYNVMTKNSQKSNINVIEYKKIEEEKV